MSSLKSTIYAHLSATEHSFYSGKCKCGKECPELTDWAGHLADVISKEFIDVTPIPALPPKAEAAETIEVQVSINGELHTVVSVKPKRLPL